MNLCRNDTDMQSNHRRSPPAARSAFSLVELVVVVAIIGVIASIAVPRVTGAAANASTNALQATLSNVRRAIDVYYAEHGCYPGYKAGTRAADDTAFANQLILYSSEDGRTNATPTSDYRFGPYLRAPFPRNLFNNLQTVKVKAVPGVVDPAAGSVGWVTVLSHGYFGISATDADLDSGGMDTPTKKELVRVATE